MKNLKTLIKKALQNKKVLLLKGAPGVGKSSLIETCAREIDSDVVTFLGSICDPVDLKGFPYEKNGKAGFLPFGQLDKLLNPNGLTTFFLDDIGQSPSLVQAGFMQWILLRQVNGAEIADNVRFIAATNERKHKAGVSQVLAPLVNRCTVIEMQPVLEEWVADFALQNVRPEVIAFFRLRPELFGKCDSINDLENFPSPRAIANMSEWIDLQVTDLEVFTGCVGPAVATEFSAFLRVYESLKDLPAKILSDPENAPVPSKMDLLYALTGMLRHKANPLTINAIATYSNKLPNEFNTLLWNDLRNKGGEVVETHAFAQWTAKKGGEFNANS